MAYWGYFVVGRSERPLAELGALTAASGMTLLQTAPGGWQVWEYPSGDGDVGSMNALARETGAPALFGYVMNSVCVAVEAAAPQSGAWTTCLARRAMAGYLAGGPGDGEQEGLGVEDYFLTPGEAAERAVAWAAEAGHTVAPGPLAQVLGVDPDPSEPLAENLFFRFLDRLGVVPL
ncbi:hypothetical protein AQJ43_02980 [Streptomyces avermitilis]|uniref:Uncharacterized protein n=2 Tax=Streptomyces avermitilis TaxID=33903 RepID=Q82HW6_STRAW|nr:MULTISPECIES: hypothetical protein [Streptomyces]KUN56577.1 hypothetical protein AQJ43_02980 [Streptomyces avermitilis]MYS98992.1 hypothetical protein [Streptomyces sp. SID5469]OOV32694.1 hypothetical protein SM007_07790 [Streptomyces avermitilis]BAC71103.1 hypothetical protein SAVERM_3391 [Streptomyces avermitilis MA-4680 = NBRC 14893]BBJ51276.1 hypothetical protein SAVMC3_39050 [Streptomyces avermitilis]